MDIEDWEILPRGGFIDYHGEDDDGEKINRTSNPKSKFNMNYFVCPSSPPRMLLHPNRVVPVPFQLEPVPDHEAHEDATKVVPSMTIMPEIKGLDDIASPEKSDDQDPISQVFFKKMSENEFVDMKMDSPKSPTKDQGEILESKICSPRIMKLEGNNDDHEEVDWEENEGGLNLWKWSLSGIGAICSFGVAAATFCVIIFGSQQRTKQHDHHNHKTRFQIYADDKRIKQVVQQATKLNEAITAVRGVPISRAHITYGGYYEPL